MTGSIGNTLKEARSKKSISLEEVHSKIKIHPRVLQLLEENKFEKLPSPLFVKSFLKSYADFLEVNSEELVEAYEKEGRKDPEQILFIKPAQYREKEATAARLGKKAAAPVFLGAVILAGTLGIFAFRQLDNYFQKPKTAARRPAVIVKTDAAESKKPPKKSNQWLRSVELGDFPNIPKSTALKLQIKAIDNVWLRITVDGKVLFQSILKKGAAESWTAKSHLEIWTGNSSNMVLTLNGYSLGSPGKGVVKKMTVSHEGVKIPL